MQVAALDRQAALKLLRVILGGKFIRRRYELRERTSRWLWALLARLPDAGEMDYAEVGWVRELGKRAVLMMVSMAQMEALQEEVEEGDLEGEEDVDDGEEEEEEEDGFVGELMVDEQDEGGTFAPGPAGKDRVCAPEGDADRQPTETTRAFTGDETNEDGEMDMDLDDGEISDDDDDDLPTAGNKDIEADIAAAKARLLARLGEDPDAQQEELTAAHADEDHDNQTSDGEGSEVDEAQARANMRATLNMILTVAGEFYGQRDLLEFRDPFPAL